MTRGLKLSLGSLLFFGANGITFPLLEKNFREQNLWDQLGGGGQWFWQTKGETKFKGYDLKLDSSDKKDNISISCPTDHSRLTKTQLDLRKPDTQLNLKNFNKLNFEENIEQNISEVLAEIKQGNNFTEIEQSAFSEFERLSKNSFWSKPDLRRWHLGQFQSAQSKIKGLWLSQKDKPRYTNNNLPSLTKDNRISLSVFFDLHRKINDAKKSLSTRLNKLLGKDETETTIPNNTKIDPIKSLSWIQWKSNRLKISKTSTNPYEITFDVNGWGDWSQNPYANFYKDEEEFKKDIQYLNQLRQSIRNDYRLANSWKLMLGAGRHTDHQSQQLQQLKNLINGDFTYRHIEARIAESLLREMGQLN